jgi:PDZ domain-containing secreted protein
MRTLIVIVLLAFIAIGFLMANPGAQKKVDELAKIPDLHEKAKKADKDLDQLMMKSMMPSDATITNTPEKPAQ